MKKFFLFVIAALISVPAFCVVGESAAFTFRSTTEAAKTPELQPADPIYYSSDLAEGTPVSVTITVQDVSEPSRQATLFSDTTGSSVKGNYYWDYTQSPYSSWPSSHTYQLTETVTSSSETKSFYHNVTIVPEPLGFLLLGIMGFLFFRKRAKSLAAAIIAMMVLGTFNAKAECTVTVSGTQFYPLSRMVIIDYTLSSASATKFSVDFSCTCSDDDWATTYKLSDYGMLSGEGADGTVNGTGAHTIYWTPGSAFDNKDVSMKVQVTAEEIPPTYMVIDLNDNCSVSYLEEVPSGGWTDAHKTTKLVLRYIEAGTYFMGSTDDEPCRGDAPTDCARHEVTLTKPYYIGVFELTQAQYVLITGESNPSYYDSTAQNADFRGEKRPVNNITYDMVDGFISKLNEAANKTFSLPTEAQWEYACRAGTTTGLNDGHELSDEKIDSNLNKLGRYLGDGEDLKGDSNNPSIYNNAPTYVGLYDPNAWGLYDMHGNIAEITLDCIYPYSDTNPVTDQIGRLDWHSTRGGYYLKHASECRSAARGFLTRNTYRYRFNGFRVILPLE